MKIAFFDCYAGAAGDMIVAAMLNAGLDRDILLHNLRSLDIGSVDYRIHSVVRHGITALLFEPKIGADAPSHGHSHDQKDPHGCHDHHHSHEASPRHEAHRNLSEIRQIIRNSVLSPVAKQNAEAVFDKLGRVEAAIHGKSIKEIHFHEVGAVDSIVDIVAACVGLDAMGIDKVFCSPLAVGSGTIHCAHGVLPVPAPATAELLRQANVPIVPGPGQFELLTPTAAAILTHFAAGFGPLESMTISSIGYGAGSRDPEGFPNVLRLLIGHADDPSETDSVLLLECNIDDSSAEQIGFAFDLLLDAGALDVFTTPILMKHNRPAITLSILCEPQNIVTFETILFQQGLTLGIRKQVLQRSILPRQITTIQTCYGPIRIKTASFRGQQVFIKPEYSDCQAAAKKNAVALNQVHREALMVFQAGMKAKNGNPPNISNS